MYNPYIDLMNESGFIGNSATVDYLDISADASIGGSLTLSGLTPSTILTLDPTRKVTALALAPNSLLGTNANGLPQGLVFTTTTGMSANVAASTLTLNTPQDISITASPQFVNTTLSSLTASLPLRSSATSTITTGATSLATEVTGTLAIANGGTNSATALNNNRIMVSTAGSHMRSRRNDKWTTPYW